MRPEQTAAVEKTATYFEKAEKDDPQRPPKFLWNAKMRFGKREEYEKLFYNQQATMVMEKIAPKQNSLLSKRHK